MERVSVIKGDLPILFVAPHGVDDLNTAFLTDKLASELGAFAVINRGWKKSERVDFLNDLANCNNISHCHEDVVREEFLHPILKTVSNIQKNIDDRVFIFYIHGCSDDVKILANDMNLDIVIGYGEGKNPSYSCDLKIKDAFCCFLEKEKFGVYQAKKNKLYSGRSKNNMNQLFKTWYPNDTVHSLQLEIVNELRSDIKLLHAVCDHIVGAIDDLIMFDDATDVAKPKEKFI